MTAYPSDLEIANAAHKKSIDEIASVLNINEKNLIKFGDDKAKLNSDFIDSVSKNENGKLIISTIPSSTVDNVNGVDLIAHILSLKNQR